MKSNILRLVGVLVVLSAASLGVFADEYYEVNTSPDARRKDYRQGEVIVKFKDDSQVSVKRSANGRFKSAGVSTIDNLLRQIGVEEMEPLMPLYGTLSANTPRKIRSHNGTEVEVRDMSRLYCLKFNAEDTQGVEKIVEQLNALSEVEFAEPNYLVYINSSSAPNDPLYPEQWGIPAVHADELWEEPLITDKRPVVAILDTGVDIAHPDLQANIWTNPVESTGSGGYDDDSNGFTDDVCGWDFVNQTGIIQDYNGHGTHCAGIAAAVGDNGIGICGANPDALIMPVTVMQSDGTGDVATIIKGIDYAAANGADVISMSFGGYAYSIAEEQALARAYAKAVLVAAAGNDGKCIYPHKCPINKENGSPMFPAAFTFVFGVQAYNAPFSNYDEDGPIAFAPQYFSEEQMYNYELTAPGTNIMSTYPGGRYKALNGTSMACPLVAGAVSRLLSVKEYQTKELLFGDLIHSAGENVNFKACYDITDADRKPNVSLVSWRIEDEKDNDGRFDAGETIRFYPTIRNEWGTAQNIVAWLELGELEGKVVEITHAMADFAKPLNSYAKAESADPIVFRLKDDVADGRHIRLVFYAQCAGMDEPSRQEFVITVENVIELRGLIDHDMVLEPVLYRITSNVGVKKGVTLTISPGATIDFESGEFLFEDENDMPDLIGTKESPITIYSVSNPGFKNFEYVIFKDSYHGDYIPDYKLSESNIHKYKNCNFIEPSAGHTDSWASHCEYCNFISYSTNWLSGIYIRNCQKNWKYNNVVCREQYGNTHLNSNNIIQFCGEWRTTNNPNFETIDKGRCYYGTAIMPEISPYSIGLIDYSKVALQPYPQAHGIIWRVVVDGYDAQDEFDLLPPLGVGRHKFEVWYSKKIDESEAPTIAMGVRPPYTQTAIAEDGSWRTETTHLVSKDAEGNINEEFDVEHSVYTAYLDIKGGMDIDGLNRIYVSGCKDLENFEIPIENTRFNVEVAAAGSMSSGFMAEPGLGKVTLTWDNQDENVDDILGYNLYRYQVKQRTENVYDLNPETGNYEWFDRVVEYNDTIRVNQRLLDETQFVDYDVVPGTNYNYYYKIMRTNMAENSPSRVVSVTPLTASKGDANGSMSVDVADVVTEVSYITGGNPQPFIFEAADVNDDEEINVLDIVGTVRIILNPGVTSNSMNDEGVLKYWIDDNVLWIDNDIALGGVQFNIDGVDSYTVLDDLSGFETVSSRRDDSLLLMSYSMTGRTIAPGRHALLNLEGKRPEVMNAVASDAEGHNVVTMQGDMTGMMTPVGAAQMRVPTPNPFTDAVTIPFAVGEGGNHEVRIVFSDLTGNTVGMHRGVYEYGEHAYTWRPALEGGIYLATLYLDGTKVQTAKLVKK